MHDWLISKKKLLLGIGLPIYECTKCGNFEVIGGHEELKSKAIAGWNSFEGNSIRLDRRSKIECKECKNIVSRIGDVGNVWLDAESSSSTLPDEWFPADFITESFPDSLKLVLLHDCHEYSSQKTNPFNTVLGYASFSRRWTTNAQILGKLYRV